MSLKVKIKADASQFDRTMSKTKKSVRGFGKSLLGMKSALAGVAVAMGAAFATRKIVDFIASSSKAASSVESLTTQFSTLLGSTEKAKERMEEIVEFAAKTPFEIEGLARTSKLLQTLGGTLLATGDGLRLVGDAAALAGQPLEEVGLHVGRLFNAITSGTSAGESVNRLQELGLITGKVKLKFEGLAKAQKSGKASTLSSAQALKELQNALSRTEGAMENLSATTEGKLSNLQDNIEQVKVSFGTGFNEGLKTALDAMNEGIPKMNDLATEMGQQLGSAISEAVNGDTDRFVAIGVLIGTAIKEGLKVSASAITGEIGEFIINKTSAQKFSPGGALFRAIGANEKIKLGNEFQNKANLREAAANIQRSYAGVTAIPSATPAAAPSGPSLLDTFNSQSGGAGAQRSGFGNAFDEQAVDILKDIREAVKPSYAP